MQPKDMQWETGNQGVKEKRQWLAKQFSISRLIAVGAERCQWLHIQVSSAMEFLVINKQPLTTFIFKVAKIEIEWNFSGTAIWLRLEHTAKPPQSDEETVAFTGKSAPV